MAYSLKPDTNPKYKIRFRGAAMIPRINQMAPTRLELTMPTIEGILESLYRQPRRLEVSYVANNGKEWPIAYNNFKKIIEGDNSEAPKPENPEDPSTGKDPENLGGNPPDNPVDPEKPVDDSNPGDQKPPADSDKESESEEAKDPENSEGSGTESDKENDPPAEQDPTEDKDSNGEIGAQGGQTPPQAPPKSEGGNNNRHNQSHKGNKPYNQQKK